MMIESNHYGWLEVRGIFLTEDIIRKNLTFRVIFFVIYFMMTINVVVAEGLNFISILLAAFAARDFVQAVRMGKFYLEMRKKNAKKNDENTKK